jgi:PhnB protein
MAQKLKPIPEGMRSLTPYITVNDAARAIDFYTRAFGAKEVSRHLGPDGSKIMHAQLQIGDSMMMLSDEFPFGICKSPQSLGGLTSSLWIYTEDTDAAFNRAVQAGATARMPPKDMFWGDRMGVVLDPFGHAWTLATRVEEVSPEEMKRRGDIEMAKMGQRSSTA